VTDTTGAVVPAAKVSVRNEATGASRHGTTNGEGLYLFADLPVGTYEVRVERDGFKAAITGNVVLNVAESRAVDVQLEAGGITEEVTVQAEAVAVQTI